MKRVRRDDLVGVWLKEADRRLILDETFVDRELHARISMGEAVRSAAVRIKITPDQLNELLEHIAAAANHVSSRTVEKKLDAIYDRLEEFERTLEVVDELNVGLVHA